MEGIKTIFVFGSYTHNAILKDSLFNPPKTHTRLSAVCVKRGVHCWGAHVHWECISMHVFLCMWTYLSLSTCTHHLNYWQIKLGTRRWKQTKPVRVPSRIGYLIFGVMSEINRKLPSGPSYQWHTPFFKPDETAGWQKCSRDLCSGEQEVSAGSTWEYSADNKHCAVRELQSLWGQSQMDRLGSQRGKVRTNIRCFRYLETSRTQV